MRWPYAASAALCAGALAFGYWHRRPHGREIGYYEVHTYEGDVVQAWEYENGIFRSPRMVAPVEIYAPSECDGVVRLKGYRAANRGELVPMGLELEQRLLYGYFGSVENHIPTAHSWAWADLTVPRRPPPPKPAWVKPAGPR